MYNIGMHLLILGSIGMFFLGFAEEGERSFFNRLQIDSLDSCLEIQHPYPR